MEKSEYPHMRSPRSSVFALKRAPDWTCDRVVKQSKFQFVSPKITITMNPVSRRHFLSTAALAGASTSLLRSALGVDEPAKVAVTGTITTKSNAAKVGGFHIGSQCWTFNNFSVIEAIEFTARSGGTIVEFYPGQKFAPDSDLKWGHDATEDQAKRIADELAKWKITPMNYGVVGVPNKEADARKIFDFAKKWNLYGITTESADAVDLLEKLAKEYDVKVCFHNHPRQPKNPNYKVWDPNYIMELTKDRDARIGACADTGHWIRSGLNALECLKILGKRTLSMHLKDRIDEKSEDQIFGRGKANVIGMLEYVRTQGFDGNVSIEYETNWKHSLADVSQCIGYVRAAGQFKGWEV